MTAGTRTRRSINATGSADWPQPDGTMQTSLFVRTRDDYVTSSNGRYGAFITRKYKCEGSRINGHGSNAFGRTIYNNVPTNFYDFMYGGHAPIPHDDRSLALTTLANANPNLPDISVPNVLFELRELPSLIKDSGSTALSFLRGKIGPKAFASANLQAQFGYSPMVQDALKLGQLSKSIDNRLQMMQLLKKHGRINKKKRLGEYYDRSVSRRHTFESGSVYLAVDIENDTTTSVWGISEWVLDSPLRSPLFTSQSNGVDRFLNEVANLIPNTVTDNSVSADAGTRGVAARSLTGTLRYSLTDLWNVLPWSWCVDYFTNTGDLIAASDNRLGLRPNALAICKHTRAFRSHAATSNVTPTRNATLSAGRNFSEIKQRTPISISSAMSRVKLFEDFITPNQIGILSSIFLLKNRNKRNPNPYMGWANSVAARIL